MNIEPTGNPWSVEIEKEATVVIATDAMKVKIHGQFRQRERKLFVLLVHAVWAELGEKKRHTLEVNEISRIFSEVTGSKNQQWIWEYFQNIAEIKVTYKSENLEGLFRLLGAAKIDKEKGIITFEIPQDLIDVLLAPQQWARLRTHFIIGLSGKYSVSLYQFLESKINLKQVERQGYIDIKLAELKDWLGLGGEYNLWSDFERRVLNPAVQEINTNPIGATFNIETEKIIGKRRKVIGIRFRLTKTSKRLTEEKQIKVTQKAKGAAIESTIIPPFRGTVTYEKAKKIAKGLDIYLLEQAWRKSIKETDIEVNNPEAHFLGFVKKRAKSVYQ